MADSRSQSIPVIKRVVKKGHGGHHGGAWKVAYADFVTAMMALFMVLWIIGQSSKEAKEAIADYFRHPGIFTTTGAGGRKIVPIVPDPTTGGESGSFNMPPRQTPARGSRRHPTPAAENPGTGLHAGG